MNDNTKVQDAYKYYQPDNNYLELSNFYKVNVMEIKPTTQDINENIFEEDLSDVIDKLQIALGLYQKAAELENFVAQFDLACMYLYGAGTDKNYNKAFKLLEKLSRRKHTYGMKWLGHCYKFGYGTVKNMDKATYWYKKSSSLGSKYVLNN
ncbi:kinase-like domain-containing protein [Rhizophagus irregularis DAOM 181602=DAOM 197198]|nr:kinase-like domain-containing protein [Rhizophagus irregularis DAOM 181602=DAOM 197198]